MSKEEIKDYLKRVDELETKLTGEDKETYAWLIYGYNQCAKLLNETEQQCKKQKEAIDKAIEYLTSYSSIHTIQFGTENDSLNDIELNKTLDEKTLNKMTNRYLKVHDKLLKILRGGINE